MPFAKRPSQGSPLQVEISSVFVDFPGVTKIEGPDGEQLYEDTTSLESTYVEDGELVGLATPGSVKIEGFWDPQDTVGQLVVNQVYGTAGYKNFKVKDKVGTNQFAVTAFTGSFKSAPITRETKKFTAFSSEIKLRSPATLTPHA